MTDLGPLAERLGKVEDHTQTIDKDTLMKFGEGLDGRVLEKVIVALEARLTEHVGQVDRRLAEIDGQVALDLKAVDTHTAAQTSAVEKALQQLESQVRDYVAEAQQTSAAQITEVDRTLSALHEALPAKFREIVEAVWQSMEARVALELTQVENRVSSRNVAPEQLQELQSSLRGEVEALSGRLTAEMRGLAENQQSQIVPLQQGLQQLETKLTTLREELLPKIRQPALEQSVAKLQVELSSVDARVATELQSAAERHSAQIQQSETRFGEALERLRQQLAAESKTPALEQSVAKLQSDLAALGAGLESNGRPVADLPAGLGQHAAQVNAGAAAELESPQAQHRSHIEELESWWRAERTPAAEMPATPEPAAAVHVEPERVAAVHTAPGPVAPVQAPPVPEPRPEIKAEPEPEAPAVATPEPEAAQPAHQEFDAAPAADATAVNGKPKPEENPPVILFKPKESGRTWRIPLVS